MSRPACIVDRVRQPTPDEVCQGRLNARLTQTQAAQLVSPAQKMPYRTWQSYEVDVGKLGSRVIPLAMWELFLLITEQHPSLRLVAKGRKIRK